MEGSTVARLDVCPTDKTVSVVYDVARETERGKNLIANRPRLADVSTAHGTEGTLGSVRGK